MSVIAEVSDYFFNEMLNVKDEYTGVRSFSAYVTCRLAQLIIEEDE